MSLMLVLSSFSSHCESAPSAQVERFLRRCHLLLCKTTHSFHHTQKLVVTVFLEILKMCFARMLNAHYVNSLLSSSPIKANMLGNLRVV